MVTLSGSFTHTILYPFVIIVVFVFHTIVIIACFHKNIAKIPYASLTESPALNENCRPNNVKVIKSTAFVVRNFHCNEKYVKTIAVNTLYNTLNPRGIFKPSNKDTKTITIANPTNPSIDIRTYVI